MTTLEQKATEINGELNGAGYGFDPTVIITVITTILSLFKNCNLTPQQAERRAQRPGLLDRLAVRRAVRQHARDDDEIDGLTAALLDAGENCTVSDFTKLFKGV